MHAAEANIRDQDARDQRQIEDTLRMLSPAPPPASAVAAAASVPSIAFSDAKGTHSYCARRLFALMRLCLGGAIRDRSPSRRGPLRVSGSRPDGNDTTPQRIEKMSAQRMFISVVLI